ncbi:MAG TPA: DMT family transporter [Petrotogaceae bacterium]|nr:DMT family transporter [Petrotogaceae bacterium]
MKKSIFLMWLTVIFWGVSFVATKVVVDAIDPVIAAFIRFNIAWVVMFVFIRKFNKYSKKDLFYLLAASFFGVTAYFLFENSGLMYTTPTNASLIISATPLVYLLVSDILKKKLSGRIRYAGTVVAFGGVAMLVMNGRFVLKLNPMGDLLMFGAVVSWVIYTIAEEKLHHLDNKIVSRDINFLGALFFIPFLFFSENKLHLWVSKQISFQTVAGLIYLGVFCSALGYIFWNKAIRDCGAKTATNGIYFIPVVTVIADAVILGNIPNIYTIGGAALVLAGTYISEIKN